MRSWKAHKGKLHALAFSPDGRTLATAGGAETFVAVWDILSGEQVAKLDGHRGSVPAVEFSPDGKYIATSERGGTVLVWMLDSPRRPVACLSTQFSESTVGCIAFAPDGERLVAAGSYDVSWWDQPTRPTSDPRLPSGREGREMRPPVNCIRYMPDGSRFLIGSLDVEIWNTDLSTPFAFIRQERRTPIHAITVTPDCSRVAFTLKNGVPVFRLADRSREVTLHWGKQLVHSVAFARDGRSLFTAGADGTVRIWDVGTWKETRRFDWGIGNVRQVVFAPDGLTCAAGGQGGQVVIWDMDV
jgi:dipeptidyl aminopeptidase/acylaminoacyl peptidase